MTDSNTKNIDYLIVGQGLAGTLISYLLIKNNQQVLVVDNNHFEAASQYAAGITNPITGRFYVKSWRVEELIPFANDFYEELEKFLQISFHTQRNILRALENVGAENDWFAKTAQPDYEPYLATDVDASEWTPFIKSVHSFGEVTQCSQTDMPTLIQSWKEYLSSREKLITEKFDFTQLEIVPNQVNYNSITAKKVIFCEGYQAIHNPYFNYLPFRLSKGEVLIVRLPEVNAEKLLKHNIFLVPLGNREYWVGSFYDREFEHANPTEAGKAGLLEKLQNVIDTPFEVLSHEAAIRPTVNDRRPFVGLHPAYDNLVIFNGLGTKGASLGPFFAQQLTDFLLKGKQLDWEINVRRRTKKYFNEMS